MKKTFVLLLVISVALLGCRRRATDTRLHGKWRSAVDQTVDRWQAEGHSTNDNEISKAMLRGLADRDEMVFTSDHLVYEGKSYTYEIVHKGTNFVVLHVDDGVTLKGGKPLPRRFEFVKNGFWMSGPHLVTRKFNRVKE